MERVGNFKTVDLKGREMLNVTNGAGVIST